MNSAGIADIAAKLAIYWGNLAGAASGQALSTQGVGRPLSFQPGAVGSAVNARVHWDNTTETTIVTVNVPAQVLGPVSEFGTTQGFSVNASLAEITFDGASARLCNMSAVMDLTTVAASIGMRLHLNVNDSIVATSNPQTSAGKTFHEVEITQTLQPGDVVTLSMRNTTNTTNIESSPFVGMRGAVAGVDPSTGFLVVSTV